VFRGARLVPESPRSTHFPTNQAPAPCPGHQRLQSRPLSLSYGSILPTSLTLHCSRIKRLRTLGS